MGDKVEVRSAERQRNIPTLRVCAVILCDGTQLLQTNDDWDGGTVLTATFAQVGAFALPAGSKDAALIAMLPPGSYTAQVEAASGAPGIALVEVYELAP